ncbi:MAG TPA: hypothetical protein VF043_17965 [Ktedonobacteraceae bacterium]
MAISVEPLVQWVTAAPLWPEAVNATNASMEQALFAPTILRFATDSFMDEFLALLNTAPSRLGERRVQPETWREPLPVPAPLADPPLPAVRMQKQSRPSVLGTKSTAGPLQGTATDPLKLYHSAHQRFYLVSACLVCHVPGMPDRVLDAANEERATFVVRRLRPRVEGAVPDTSKPDSYDEFAFVPAAQGNTWQQMKNQDATTLVPGEEQLALFPVTFFNEEGRKRRLLSGLIPVSKREAYLGAPLTTSSSGTTPAPTPVLTGLRETLLNMQVVQPWESLDRLQKKIDTLQQDEQKTSDPAQKIQIGEQITALQNQVQVASWYILLDFAAYLAKYLPTVWQVITGQQQANTLNTAEQALLSALENAVSTTPLSLRDALAKIELDRNQLESVVDQYQPGSTEWPSFLFALTDPQVFDLVKLPDNSPEVLSTLEMLVKAALPAKAPEQALPAPPVAQADPDIGSPGWFVIRCVFERPHCGPLKPTVVSIPTQVFKMAHFFDADAPARPIRISLPFDTSFAGLRKFNKNVAFVISDKLRQQMECVSDLKGVLDGNVCKDGGQGIGIGFICSFSIPIITICALIVLFIFVILLNIVFFWLPLLEICFPVPQLKAKTKE